jgi:hypothetical protein
MNKQSNNQVSITVDKIILRFEEMEPIVIPRRTLRTRLQLVEWIYRLTGWPGMKVWYLREFVAAIYGHHGWALPSSHDQLFLTKGGIEQVKSSSTLLQHA